MSGRRWRTFMVTRETLLNTLQAQGAVLPYDAELLNVREVFGTGCYEFVVASDRFPPLLEAEMPPPVSA